MTSWRRVHLSAACSGIPLLIVVSIIALAPRTDLAEVIFQFLLVTWAAIFFLGFLFPILASLVFKTLDQDGQDYLAKQTLIGQFLLIREVAGSGRAGKG